MDFRGKAPFFASFTPGQERHEAVSRYEKAVVDLPAVGGDEEFAAGEEGPPRHAVPAAVAEEKAKDTEKPEEDPSEALRTQTKEIEETMDSFFESNPAATTYHSAYSAAASEVPTIQIPVQAETREGKVEINDDQDGYSSVTIG